MTAAIPPDAKGCGTAFAVAAVIAAIGLAPIPLFRPSHVKETGGACRKAAGRPLDNVLMDRK